MPRTIELIDLDRIFLYEENPRHEPLQSQDEIIEHLCKGEQVFNLARSISESGPNPLELLGVVQIAGSGSGTTKKNFEVWEGNRRVCAVKLLNDPDLAPPHLRQDFAKLAAASSHLPIKKITAVIFTDHDDLKFWMAVIHGGQQAGIGRKDWNSEQKQRHFGTGRNRVAQALLDASENLGLISKAERVGKLTTVQRFLNSSVVREALGIDASNPDDITYNRPSADFQKQLSRFITDLREGVKITSRHNRGQIDQYGRKLAQNSELAGGRVEPLSIRKLATTTAKKARKKAPKKPRKHLHVEYDSDLVKHIEALGNSKLESLYYSIKCPLSGGGNKVLMPGRNSAFVLAPNFPQDTV